MRTSGILVNSHHSPPKYCSNSTNIQVHSKFAGSVLALSSLSSMHHALCELEKASYPTVHFTLTNDSTSNSRKCDFRVGTSKHSGSSQVCACVMSIDK